MDSILFRKSRIAETVDVRSPTYESVPDINLKNLESIIIFPYNECNLACRMCPVKHPVRVKKAFTADPSQFEWHLDEDQLEWIASFSPRSFTVLGGEPLISPTTPFILEKLSNRVKKNSNSMMNALDILGKNIILYTNGTLVDEDVVNDLKSFDRISVVVSLEGDRAYTDYVRGPGVFDRAIRAVRMLVEADIPVSVRVGFCMENLKSVYNLIRMIGQYIPMEFSPRIDRPPLPRSVARKFYYAVASLKAADILLPSYKNFVGFNRRCPAGIKRFTVHPDGYITACQWGNEVVAKAGDDDEFLKERMYEWVSRNTRIELECLGCKKATVCFSSCRVSKDYMQCPTRETELTRAVVENLFDKAVEVKKEKTMKAIKSMRNISMAGC